jgi:hypothetical protein
VSKSYISVSGDWMLRAKMLSLGHLGMLEGLNTLVHGKFRVMLAGVGIGFFCPFPIASEVFLDGWER